MKKQILAFLILYSSFAHAQNWVLTGNTGVTSSQYLGTTDNKDLIFKRWGVQSGLIGSNSTSFGANSLSSLASNTGTNNAAFGVVALQVNTTGGFNYAFGNYALNANTTGSYNAAFGISSLLKNIGGNNNTALGCNSILNNTSGSNNTAVGYSSFYTNTTGSGNTLIGFQADVTLSNLINATALGYNAKVGASNSLVLGGTGADAVKVGIGITAPLAKLHVAGNAIIGTGMISYPAGYSLYVSDGILAERVKVAIKNTANWADYVFDANHNLLSLPAVEKFVNQNKHLPGMPSAENLVKEGGIDVAQMFAKQMEKIEELTLYIIKLNKEIEELKAKNK